MRIRTRKLSAPHHTGNLRERDRARGWIEDGELPPAGLHKALGFWGVEGVIGRAGLGQNLHKGFLGETLSKSLVEASLF